MLNKNLPLILFTYIFLTILTSCTVYQSEGRKNFESNIVTNESINTNNLKPLGCGSHSLSEFRLAENKENEISENLTQEKFNRFSSTIEDFNQSQNRFYLSHTKNYLLIASTETNKNCLYMVSTDFSQQDLATLLRGLNDSTN